MDGIRRQRWCSVNCRMRAVRCAKPDYYTKSAQAARRHITQVRGAYWWRRAPYVTAVNHQVVSVEPHGVARVYDLAIEGEWTHNFVCEGLVVHNCFEYLCVNLFLGAPTAYREERRELVRHRRHQLQRRHGVVSF